MSLAIAMVALALVGGPVTYQPPTTAPVHDPYRPPPAPWLPGNRGIEYATGPGTPVAAIGPGTVSFAGPVAGRRVVTVVHPDGLRSSYVGLAAIAVAAGDAVDGGQIVGLAAERLHLGVRRGDAYLDPASLWGTPVGRRRVVLVPLVARSARSPPFGAVGHPSLHLPIGPPSGGSTPKHTPTFQRSLPVRRRCIGRGSIEPLERSVPCRNPSSP